jgi:hypothetical protein
MISLLIRDVNSACRLAWKSVIRRTGTTGAKLSVLTSNLVKVQRNGDKMYMREVTSRVETLNVLSRAVSMKHD